MNSEVVISKIAEIIMGQSPKKNDVNEIGDGYPLLNGPTEFTDRYPEPVQYSTNGNRFSKKGDILFCVRGSTTGRMNYSDQPYAIGRGIAAIRGKDGFPTPFVKAVIENNLDRLLAAATGSTFPNVSKSLLNEFEVDVISSEEAQKANDIIVSFEEKTHLNQQTNETLEAMAQAIFKSWFVDFNPVRAKIEAKSADRDSNRAAMASIAGISMEQDWDEVESALDQKLATMTEEQCRQLTRTAQLFPDEMVESGIGELPEGWEIGKLGNICKVQGGYAFKSKLFKEQGLPVVKIKNINEDYTVSLKNGQFLSVDDTLDKETYELNDGDYVLAMTGATVGKTGIIVSNGDKIMLNQRVAKFESDQFDGNINWFIHSSFLATSLKDQIVNFARGSAQPNVSATDIESAELIIPSIPIIEEFLKIANPLFMKWIDNYKQNETLASIRYTLLPKLISGETTL